MSAESKLRGVEDGLDDVPVGHKRPCPRVPRTADLVDAFSATYYQCPCETPIAQRLCKGQSQFAFSDAEEYTTWTRGVDERTKVVKECAKGEGFAVGRDEGEGGVVLRGEDVRKRDAGNVRWLRVSRCRSDETTIKRFEDVCGARGGRRCATPVLIGLCDDMHTGEGRWDQRNGFPYLDYACACAGCDDAGGRADVECVVPVPTGPDDVDDKVLVVVLYHRFECPGTEQPGSRCEIFWASLCPVYVHRSKEGADLGGRHEIGCKEVFEGKFEVVWGKILGRLDEPLQQRFELVGRVLCHRDRFRALA